MFSSVKDFLYRHRRKFYIGGGIVGGVVLLSKFAEYKLYQWHDKQTHLMVEKQKRRQHYEKTRQTANATVLNLSSSITKIISDELEVDELLQTIRTNPAVKVKMWEELKVQGFSRCVATLYTAALIGCIVHAKLMLLGGYTYNDSIKLGEKTFAVTQDNQEKYLCHLQKFVEDGLPTIIKKIRKVTMHRVRSLNLDQSVTLEQLEGILKDITLTLCGESLPSLITDDNLKLHPWSQYVTEAKIPHFRNPDDVLFYRMTDEITDVIDSDDFNFVVQNLVQHSINNVIDYVADFYPQPKLEIPLNGVDDNLSSQEKISADDGASVRRKEPNFTNLHSSFVKASMPVAKLIPVLSDIPHPFLSPAPGYLLQFVVLNENLENLSFNIYEGFST